jgi:radical SAM protein with 4Fe4S-binding SPASM domain
LNPSEYQSQHFLDSTKQDVQNSISMFKERNLNENSFCVMPFVNVILEPDGNIGVCRHKGHNFTFGNIRHQTIEEILSSPKVVEWRKEHITGSTTICETELVDRKCNLCPHLNKLLPFAEIQNITNPKILRLTANLNGQCNLRCQMCTIWQEPNGFYNEENFWSHARKKLFREIKEIDFLSGEPFIQDDTYKFINEISPINPTCQWSFTTNLHWKLTDQIKEELDKISIKYLLISIDSLEEKTYHKIRYPGNLNFVLDNIDKIVEYEKSRIERKLSHLNMRINFLIQKDNWKEIKMAINFCLEKKLPPFVSFLYGPQNLSLLDLDYKERTEILDFYFSTLSRQEILFSLRVIKPLIKSLNNIDYAHYLLTLSSITDDLK